MTKNGIPSSVGKQVFIAVNIIIGMRIGGTGNDHIVIRISANIRVCNSDYNITFAKGTGMESVTFTFVDNYIWMQFFEVVNKLYTAAGIRASWTIKDRPPTQSHMQYHRREGA